ncbi:hypothetical protein TIFTF001_003832 [Ficus carica]|uniref:Uncharacterized protein n=1 Tax=Ficus carica TaxID=3494 RepID=A0AA88CW66_FICCA|nr:hypothetical protein TIFTF001_003832 [Ficus carica]
MAGVGVAKAKAMVMTMSSQGQRPMVAVGGLLFPFLLKLSFSLELVRKTYCDLLYSSRLFVFQLTHIAAGDHHHNTNSSNTGRFVRALRLVYERLTHFRWSQSPITSPPPFNLLSSSPHDQESALHTLSMLAL